MTQRTSLLGYAPQQGMEGPYGSSYYNPQPVQFGGARTPDWYTLANMAGASSAPAAAPAAAAAAAPAAEAGALDAVGGPLGAVSMGISTAADIFDAYQKYQADKERKRLAKKMERRQDIMWNQGQADDARSRKISYAEYRRLRAQQALADIDMLRERLRKGY